MGYSNYNRSENTTIGYYNNRADEFYKSTVHIDFSDTQERFLSRLKEGSYILDFGCGSGRDTKYFWNGVTTLTQLTLQLKCVSWQANILVLG